MKRTYHWFTKKPLTEKGLIVLAIVLTTTHIAVMTLVATQTSKADANSDFLIGVLITWLFVCYPLYALGGYIAHRRDQQQAAKQAGVDSQEAMQLRQSEHHITAVPVGTLHYQKGKYVRCKYSRASR